MRTKKEIKAEIKATRNEMKRKGIRRFSFMNAGHSPESYKLNSAMFILENELRDLGLQGASVKGAVITNPINAKWERGVKCHGLWFEEYRVGLVVRLPRIDPIPGDPYFWSLDFPEARAAWGRSKTLGDAKEAVTDAWNLAQAAGIKLSPPRLD